MGHGQAFTAVYAEGGDCTSLSLNDVDSANHERHRYSSSFKIACTTSTNAFAMHTASMVAPPAWRCVVRSDRGAVRQVWRRHPAATCRWRCIHLSQ
eukprot:6213910-Pleurochrysis_carterae.AAC.1